MWLLNVLSASWGGSQDPGLGGLSLCLSDRMPGALSLGLHEAPYLVACVC